MDIDRKYDDKISHKEEVKEDSVALNHGIILKPWIYRVFRLNLTVCIEGNENAISHPRIKKKNIN